MVAGRVSSSTFRLFPGPDGRLRNAFNTWLDQAKPAAALDSVPDCEIETGVFKVCQPVILQQSIIFVIACLAIQQSYMQRSCQGVWA